MCKIVVHFLKHIGHVVELIHAILGVVTIASSQTQIKLLQGTYTCF